MYDIHDLAAQNTTYLLAGYSDCRAYINSSRLQDFEEHLRDKAELTIATFSGFAFQNVQNGEMQCTGRDLDKEGKIKDLVLSSILQEGAYLNIYDRFEDESQRRKHMGKLWEVREKFDDTFNYGRKFKYFCFNNGQMGIPAFGDFTLAFPLSHFEDYKLVFLKYNSLSLKYKDNKTLRYYFTNNNEAIALKTLTQDLATLAHFIPLIVVKRKEDLANGTDVDYNLLILKPLGDTSKHRDYVEVITWQEVKIQTGVRLRAEKERFQSIFDAVSDLDREAEPMIKNLRELYELINTTLITTEYGY
ncbi:MAG TPA: hypothetical protein DCR35_01035 [Runella sp.]|nr:hypothetical protein [Runella sp.]HAO47995.1 hypothetical protein [Runella sp.]